MFYDFWIEHFDNDTEKLLQNLGFSGCCVFGSAAQSKSLEIIKGLAIKNKTKESADFVVLQSNDQKIQKAAIKSISVDGIRAFVKYPLIKEMAEKNICLVICFNDLLNAPDLKKVLYLMRRSVALAQKYNTPIVIASGAKSNWELRSASDLIGFGQVLGLSAGDAKKALYNFQEKIIKRTKLKKEGRYISPGIIKVKNENDKK